MSDEWRGIMGTYAWDYGDFWAVYTWFKVRQEVDVVSL